MITPPGVTPKQSGVNYGNGKLWVSLWPDGRVIARHEDIKADGSIDVKFGWWRGVQGQLVISARRLDSASPPARGDVPTGYGDQFFQASSITFPTEGCWAVRGQVGADSLEFVTEIVRGS